MQAKKLAALVLVAALATALLGLRAYLARRYAFPPAPHGSPRVADRTLTPMQSSLICELDRQVRGNIRYHDAYFIGGEPPATEGVCTDVVIRAFRTAGVDLKAAVADDVRAAPTAYHINRPDSNIDHRRARNLIVFFRRHARELPTAGPHCDWQPGDVVFWSTSGRGRADHIGMIATGTDLAGEPTVIHHWPGFPVRETGGLHAYPIAEHFRWPSPAPSGVLEH